MNKRRLILSIHDVAPAFEAEIEQLVELARPTAGDRIAMLVVPHHWNSDPLVGGSAFAARLRGWSDRGYEMFLHGWSHRDDCQHAALRDRLKAKRMTAGEGEFLGIDRQEAQRRLRDGRRLVEDVIGREVAGFIAPAWLYGAAALEAIAEADFAIAEDHWRVWVPRTDRTLSCGPVMTWASRTPARLHSSLALAATMRTIPMPATMRVAVHPPDARQPRLVKSIAATLATLGKSRPIAGYADLLV